MPLRGDCIAPGFGAVPRLATEVVSEPHREPLAQPPRCHHLTSYARARDRTRSVYLYGLVHSTRHHIDLNQPKHSDRPEYL
jgi:hypothetical protein